MILRADARNAIPDCGGEILRRAISVRFQCPLSVERPDFARKPSIYLLEISFEILLSPNNFQEQLAGCGLFKFIFKRMTQETHIWKSQLIL